MSWGDWPVRAAKRRVSMARGVWMTRVVWVARASMSRVRAGPGSVMQRPGMRVHVFTAHCTDAGRMGDRRGRRACLLKGLPHEEIARRVRAVAPGEMKLRRDDARARRRPPG